MERKKEEPKSKELVKVPQNQPEVTNNSKKVNRYKYKKFVRFLLSVLTVLLIPLLVTVSVKASKSGIDLVNPKFGELDMKNKVFYPNFDEFDLYNNGFTYSNEEKPGLLYSKIFANSPESLKEYAFKRGETKRHIKQDFFELTESTKEIVLNVNAVSSLNKLPRKVKVRVDWKNVLFVHDENGKEVFAIRKERFTEEKDRTAIFKQSFEAKKKIIDSFDFDLEKYMFAVVGQGKGDQTMLGKPIASLNYEMTVGFGKRELEDALYDWASVKLVPKEPIGTKVSIVVCKFEKGKIELISHAEVEKGTNYRLPDNIKAQAESWYYANKLIDKILPTTERLNNNQVNNITNTTYIFGSKSSEDNGVKLNVSLFFQNSLEQYLDSPTYVESLNKSEGEIYWGIKELKSGTLPDVTAFAKNKEISGINYNLFELDELKTLTEVPGIGQVIKEGEKYLFKINKNFEGENIDIKIYFKRKRKEVEFRLRRENENSIVDDGELPDLQEIVAGGKLQNPNPSMGKLRMTDDDIEKHAIFEGWALEDSDNAEVINLNNYEFRDNKFFIDADTIKLYAKWKKTRVNYVLRKEDVDGGYTLDGETDAYSFKKVYQGQKISFLDIQADIYDRINVANLDKTYDIEIKEYSVSENNEPWRPTVFTERYRNENGLRLGVKLKRKVKTITLDTDKEIIGDIDDAVEVSSDKKILSYRCGYTPSKQPRIANTDGKVFKGWKYGHREFKFDGSEELNVNMTLQPIWQGKYVVKFKLLLEDENGNISQSLVEDSLVSKSEGDTVTHAELYPEVRAYVENLGKYKNETFTYVDESGNPTSSAVNVVGDGIILRFIVYRAERKITLDTTFNVTKASDALSVSGDYKTIGYRHGYRPQVKPIISDTLQLKFKCWEYQGEEYLFDGTREITSDILLTPKFEYQGYLITIEIPSNLQVANLRYEDTDVQVITDTNSKIQLLVQTVPYVLKPLKYDGNAIDTNSGKKVNIKYNQDTVNGNADIYLILIVNSGDYEGYYPQTLDTSVVPEETTESRVDVALKFGTLTYYVAIYNGFKYEKINNKYYKYEKVQIEKFPLNSMKTEKWTSKVIDVSIYNKKDTKSNKYSTSYVKSYLEKVVAVKMGIDANKIRLPLLGNRESLDNAKYEIPGYVVNTTDYAREALSNYKITHGIPSEIEVHNPEKFVKFVWTGTRVENKGWQTFTIHDNGKSEQDEVNSVMGLRPSVWQED